jgi:hypothetical protein
MREWEANEKSNYVVTYDPSIGPIFAKYWHEHTLTTDSIQSASSPQWDHHEIFKFCEGIKQK